MLKNSKFLLKSWGHGYPEITAKCPSYNWNINQIPLNLGFKFKIFSNFS